LGISDLVVCSNSDTVHALLRDVADLKERSEGLEGRIDDLEAAYPDYSKAKEKAEENKAQQVVPGFVPWSQRKRRAEAAMRRKADTK